MTDDEIKRRLADFEDGWIERKQKGVSTDDIRKTLVAFANSIPDGEEAILFIGVANDGKITGVDNPEKRQREVSKTALEWCYPPIKHTIRVIEVDGYQVVAVIVQSSQNKPHFAGPAFIRVGSRSMRASDEMFQSLIELRLGTVRELTKWLDKDILIESDKGQYPPTWSGASVVKLRFVNSFRITVEEEDGRLLNVPLEKVIPSFDSHRQCLKLLTKQ